MIDIIGTIYTPGTYDTEGNELTPPVKQPGYHVNVIEVTPELEPFVIHPATPSRAFAGAITHCLKFKDRDEWLSLGLESTDDEGNRTLDDAKITKVWRGKWKKQRQDEGLELVRKNLKDYGMNDLAAAFTPEATKEMR